MNIVSCAFCVIFFIIFVQCNASSCNCGLGEGTDMCTGSLKGGSSCHPMIVRPRKIPRLFKDITEITRPRVVCKEVGGISNNNFLAKLLKPSGDLCSCKQSIVMPATVPQPQCRKCSKLEYEPRPSRPIYESVDVEIDTPRRTLSTGYGGIETEYIQGGHINGHGTDYLPETKYTDSVVKYEVPADAVSLSLAYNARKNNCIKEGHLNYGFQKLPKEEIRENAELKRLFSEDNIHKYNADLIELKPLPCKKSVVLDVDAEAMDDLLLTRDINLQDEREVTDIGPVTIRDIGFAPTEVKRVSYKTIRGNGDFEERTVDRDPIDPPCEDGFRSGHAIIRNIPQKEVYITGKRIPDECEETRKVIAF